MRLVAPLALAAHLQVLPGALLCARELGSPASHCEQTDVPAALSLAPASTPDEPPCTQVGVCAIPGATAVLSSSVPEFDTSPVSQGEGGSVARPASHVSAPIPPPPQA